MYNKRSNQVDEYSDDMLASLYPCSLHSYYFPLDMIVIDKTEVDINGKKYTIHNYKNKKR